MRMFLYALLGVGLIAPTVLARPVSYEGGTTLMLRSNGEFDSLHLHYSPRVDNSIGYKFEDWVDEDFVVHAVQLNHLLKRWNQTESQGNLYLKSGLGVSKSGVQAFEDEWDEAGFVGFSADWENRRFFTSYGSRYTHAGDFAGFFSQSARLGVAPYLGGYGDLHTWFMLHVDHMPEDDDPLKVTPLVRLFKGVHLVEAGVSDGGDFLLNYVLRF
ncbi:MAG: hypothetical protein AAGB46_00520 [Verrucomicrobiota bacterium]